MIANKISFRLRTPLLSYLSFHRSSVRLRPCYTSRKCTTSTTSLREDNFPPVVELPKKTVQDERKEFCIVNLYHLVDIPDPDHVVELHKSWMNGCDIKGRIYFSNQGVNAQFTGPVLEIEKYLNWMKEQCWFSGLKWNSDPVKEHMFPRLRLKVKPNLVQLNGGISDLPVTDPISRATPLNSVEWKERLAEAEKINAVVLDVRNGYEWDAGHFEGSVRPPEDSFSETPVAEEIPASLKDVNQQTPILMYCTGGIRCDVYSTVLRKKGFTNLYTLQGGVQQYFKDQGGELWNGSLFVFDGRMAISPEGEDGSKKELPSTVHCEICGGEGHVPHVNCANVDCNRLFIACESCKVQLHGCCSERCIEAPRLLRPYQDSGGYYGKFGTYATRRLQKSLEAGHARSLAKRQRRLESLRKKREALRETKLKLKRLLREQEEERRKSPLTAQSIKDALRELQSFGK